MVDNKAAGLKRYKANTLYWNVKVGDRLMANSAWRFKLYGTKIFTDVRGDESITYKVAVISMVILKLYGWLKTFELLN